MLQVCSGGSGSENCPFSKSLKGQRGHGEVVRGNCGLECGPLGVVSIASADLGHWGCLLAPSCRGAPSISRAPGKGLFPTGQWEESMDGVRAAVPVLSLVTLPSHSQAERKCPIRWAAHFLCPPHNAFPTGSPDPMPEASIFSASGHRAARPEKASVCVILSVSSPEP